MDLERGGDDLVAQAEVGGMPAGGRLEFHAAERRGCAAMVGLSVMGTSRESAVSRLCQLCQRFSCLFTGKPASSCRADG